MLRNLTALFAATCLCLSVAGAEKAPPKADPKAQPAEKPAPPDPFVVPDGTPEELLTYLERLRDARPEGRSPEVVQQFQKKWSAAVIAAADKVLAGKPSDEQAEAAVRWKLTSLLRMRSEGDESAAQRLEAMPAELAKAGYKTIARRVRGFSLQDELRRAADGRPDDLKKVVAGIAQFLGDEGAEKNDVGLAINATFTLESAGSKELAAEACTTFAKVLAASKDPGMAAFAPKLEGAARRILLVGQKMHLEGAYLDGEKFDWKPYDGKVVLVQFWATWCGPCRREIVGIKQQYERYRDRGFEVLGINLDNTKEAVEEYLKKDPLPWKSLFSTDEKQGGMDHPMATYYGVLGIPQLILVGKDGKVVSLSVRGAALARELEKLLGPIAEEPGAGEKEKP